MSCHRLLLLTALLIPLLVFDGTARATVLYLDDGTIKIGIDLSLGGAITYLAADSGADTNNLINSYDKGREIQQSYYSGPNPYLPAGAVANSGWPNWPWNPIQVGDSFGNTAAVLASYDTGTELYVETQPLQWALKDVPGQCTFEDWITLNGNVVTVQNRLTNARTDTSQQFAAMDQELPAVYTVGTLSQLLTYTGTQPFTSGPTTTITNSGPPWVYFRATENWAAYLNSSGWGLGVYSPGTDSFIGGFAGTPGSGGTSSTNTGYIAPTRREILDSNIVYNYTYNLILGTSASIRSYVYNNQPNTLPNYQFQGNRQSWSYVNASDSGFPVTDHLHVLLGSSDPEMISPYCAFQAAAVPTLYIRAAFSVANSSDQAQLFWEADNGALPMSSTQSYSFSIIDDGQYHTYALNLASVAGWTGEISQLRFDPIAAGAPGDYMNIQFISYQSTGLPTGQKYWNGLGTSWNSIANWSTVSTATTPGPTVIPGHSDNVTFNITTANGPESITLDANQTALSLTFNNTGSTTLLGGGLARTLTLGTGGITIASSAGAVTLGDGTAGNEVLINLASGEQTWTNSSANAFTINVTTAAFTRSAGATLNFIQASSGAFSISATALPNVNGIIGPWAFFGTGANTRYACNNAGTIAGFTGTAAASGANLTDTTGTANYELAAGGGTVPATVSANTIRYSGTAGTAAPGAASFTVNGLLNAGTGLWTIGGNTITIGANKELVVNTANNDIAIASVIADNGGGASSLTKTGAGTLTLTAANTFSGLTTIGAGTLALGNSAALQNSPWNTSGGGTMTLSNVTTPVFGGLAGSTDLASAITGYGGVTALTLNPGAGAGNTYSGAIADGASGMTLTLTGSGLQVLSGANTYSGGTILSGGTLNAGSASALGSGGNITFAGGTLQYSSASAGQDWSTRFKNSTTAPVTLDTNSQNVTLGGIIDSSNTGGLTKAGSGTLTLTGSNTYGGPTTIRGGTLELSGAAAAANVTLTNPSFEADAGIANSWMYQTITGWTNSAGGGVGIEQGSSRTWAPAAPPNYNATTNFKWAFIQSGQTLYQTIDVTSAGTYTVGFAAAGRPGNNGSGNNYGPMNIQVQIDGVDESPVFTPSTSAWGIYSSNPFTLSAGTHTLAFDFINALGGDKSDVLDAVTIAGMVSNLLPATTSLRIAGGGTLDLGGNNQQVASLSDSGPGSGGSVINSNTASAAVLTLSPTNTSTTFSGRILGGGALGTISLVISGSGTQELSGSNSYEGGTFVNAGELDVANAAALPSGSSLTLGSAVGSPDVVGLTTASPAAPLDDVAAVPEPGSLALLGVAGIVAAAAAWRKGRKCRQTSGGSRSAWLALSQRTTSTLSCWALASNSSASSWLTTSMRSYIAWPRCREQRSM